MNLYRTDDKDLALWLMRKEAQGLLMPCHDDQAPILTHEEATTLAVLSDAMGQMRRLV